MGVPANGLAISSGSEVIQLLISDRRGIHGQILITGRHFQT
jgi:hypothetical protein